MNEKQQEFLDGLKKLPIAELTGYQTAGIFARRLVNISGIALALIICYFPTGLNIAAGAIGLLYLAKTSTNINMSLTEINKLLQTRS